MNRCSRWLWNMLAVTRTLQTSPFSVRTLPPGCPPSVLLRGGLHVSRNRPLWALGFVGPAMPTARACPLGWWRPAGPVPAGPDQRWLWSRATGATVQRLESRSGSLSSETSSRVGGGSSHPPAMLRHQLEVLQLNSVLTPPSQRQNRGPQLEAPKADPPHLRCQSQCRVSPVLLTHWL